MGERWQCYVKTKWKDKGIHYTAVHDQWCYGADIPHTVAHVIKWIEDNPPSSMMYSHDFDNMIECAMKCRIYGQEYQYNRQVHLIELDETPDRADSNHGCVIIDATDETEVKFALYDDEGRYMLLDDARFQPDSKFKYNVPDINKQIGEKASLKLYKQTCKEMMELYQRNILEKI